MIENNMLLLIIGGATLLVLIAAIVVMILLLLKVNKLRKDYELFMKDADGNDVSATLKACIRQIDVVTKQNKKQDKQIEELYDRLVSCMQKVGLVRFNAFDNVGSNQSYALAALDENNNGFVLSGIYARESSTSYMKPVIRGKSKYPLSDEEEKAIYNAIAAFGKNERYTEPEDDVVEQSGE